MNLHKFPVDEAVILAAAYLISPLAPSFQHKYANLLETTLILYFHII